MSTAATAELIHAMRQLVDTNHQILAAARASLPQWYDLPLLQVRWCLGREACKALLRDQLGYQGEVGKPVRIHVDDVLALDEVMKNQRAAMHAGRVA